MSPRVSAYAAAFVTIISWLGLTGCDENWAKRFDRGAPIPNARLLLELPEPQSIAQLFPRYQQAASLGGFPYKVGRPMTVEEVEASSSRFFSWVAKEEYSDSINVYEHSVEFFTPRGEKSSTHITFIFHNDSTDSFTKDEWLWFFQWRDEYLPQVFPEAIISIIRHPAVFTDLETIAEIEEELGIHVPEEYKRD